MWETIFRNLYVCKLWVTKAWLFQKPPSEETIRLECGNSFTRSLSLEKHLAWPHGRLCHPPHLSLIWGQASSLVDLVWRVREYSKDDKDLVTYHKSRTIFYWPAAALAWAQVRLVSDQEGRRFSVKYQPSLEWFSSRARRYCEWSWCISGYLKQKFG